MIGFCPLASGSKGNCIFVGTKTTRVLIDAGLSVLELTNRLRQIDVDVSSIQAVLVTHEHSDHIKGLKTLVERFGIPVLTNAETAKGISAVLGTKLRYKLFTTGEPFVFGDLEVHPFSISHDTLDPVAFTIVYDGLKMGFCTDLGFATSLVKKHLEKCDYLYLEANHQPSMVYASARPEILKQRILGRQGHLSNEDCARLLVTIWHEGLKHVHLAHLSRECNTAEVALQVVGNFLQEQGITIPLSIAYQETISQAISFHSNMVY